MEALFEELTLRCLQEANVSPIFIWVPGITHHVQCYPGPVDIPFIFLNYLDYHMSVDIVFLDIEDNPILLPNLFLAV